MLPLRKSILFTFLGAISLAYSSASSASSAKLSPVANFEPSWAASVAQSSCLVSKYSETGAVVLIVYSDDAKTRRSTNIDPENTEQRLLTARDCDSMPNIKVLGNGCACVIMVGFAPDVAYLTSALQRRLDREYYIYEGSKTPTALFLANTLADYLQGACSSQDGRPYGVQSLLLGKAEGASSQTNQDSLRLCTLDPSGMIRHWPVATCIGRGAVDLRKTIHKQLERPATTPKDSLRQLVNAVTQEDDTKEGTTARFSAFHVWMEQGSVRVAQIESTPHL